MRWAQFAQVKVPVIEPSNGWEHFSQNGATMRVAFPSHAPHTYSPAPTFAPQFVQNGGYRSETAASNNLSF
jgi:hypothetical protein